ncbi:sigma-70 family RNA polymerase sigma factor [Phaeacidiphilus oryzae]|uniref:sigma-70 family RNA polymerase sigma factor n=1 Tax=Phaeacidiphilus oryzae TaxID=348818 RepID=UPI000561EFC7|nr:sigma-70 family RNA polymerase sigma factor [Phaeacidiphilus oryzae]
MAGPAAAAPEAAELEQYRRELTGYCYRMLGSAFEAEDAVQEAMVRAWRGLERFEGRSSLRSWLYRIATNVCLDMLNGRQRRARPMDLEEVGSATGPLKPPLPEEAWLGPIPDSRILDDRALDERADPAAQAVLRDSVRLALVAALQELAPKQRAVLILREALGWSAAEVAELLETTVPAVNSALQRARAVLAEKRPQESEPYRPMDAGQREFLARYVDAFQRYDLETLASLVHEDVVMQMPPLPLWLRGRDEVTAWLSGIGQECEGSVVVPVGAANGLPAFGQYRDGGATPWALQVLEIEDGRITGLNSFLDVDRLFPLFGLPEKWTAGGGPDQAEG